MSREKSSGGLSVPTLIVAALSAAAAALVVPMIWRPGTVVASAITPIVVALVGETLRRPVERVSSVSTWRRTPSGGLVREERFEPAAGEDAYEVVEGERPEDPFGLREPARRSVVRRHPLRIALITGLLAFAIAAAVVTASELTLFRDSVSSSRHRTTFFGGTPSAKATPTATPEPAPGAQSTPAPAITPTPTPGATTTPVGTPPPQPQGTPAPTPSVQPPDPAATP